MIVMEALVKMDVMEDSGGVNCDTVHLHQDCLTIIPLSMNMQGGREQLSFLVFFLSSFQILINTPTSVPQHHPRLC